MIKAPRNKMVSRGRKAGPRVLVKKKRKVKHAARA